jgi:cell division protein FtsI/penicillin-binding protein 2
MKNERRYKISILSVGVLIVGLLFVARLYNIQIQHAAYYRAEAEKQYISTSGNMYERGKIYMRKKDGARIEVANIAQGWMMTMNPKNIENIDVTYARIAEFYPELDKNVFFEKAQQTDIRYIEVAHRIPDAIGLKISELKLGGIQLYRESWRTYPGGDVGGQVIGFVGYKGDTFSGQYGIERYYNEALTRNEENVKVNYFAELFGSLKNVIYDRKEAERGDIVLTLEPNVQAQLEQTLARMRKDFSADQVGGIVMDVQDGSIYAMAAAPTFNLNEYGKVEDISVFRNPLVEDVFEMGSIVKPLTVAAALDVGVITPESIYNDLGTMTLNGKTFSNYDGKARGPGTPVQKILNQSLNTGVAWLTLKMGRDTFADYFLNRYQLGQETGIDLPGEASGLMSTLSAKRDLEYCTASFGQGFAVSPINITTALASLGNGGRLVTPHIVREIVYKDGSSRTIVPPEPFTVLKNETSGEISRMLSIVVDEALLGGKVKIPEYSVAAKTGTAQMARSDGRGYETDKYLHTFFAYAPAYEPRFIVFIMNKNPKGAEYASQSIGKPAMELVRFLLNYYSINPDRAQGLKRPLIQKPEPIIHSNVSVPVATPTISIPSATNT